MHEITVAQFQAFRRQHDFDRTRARESDAPANMVKWYDTAAYCNWLSEQEGIPRDQWCYDPDQPFQDGMSLLPDYLQRTGYRLPSEAEWECACRAGTTTARYFGETEMLLGGVRMVHEDVWRQVESSRRNPAAQWVRAVRHRRLDVCQVVVSFPCNGDQRNEPRTNLPTGILI